MPVECKVLAKGQTDGLMMVNVLWSVIIHRFWTISVI